MECCHSYWCNYRAAHNFFSAAFNDDLYNTFWARIFDWQTEISSTQLWSVQNRFLQHFSTSSQSIPCQHLHLYQSCRALSVQFCVYRQRCVRNWAEGRSRRKCALILIYIVAYTCLTISLCLRISGCLSYLAEHGQTKANHFWFRGSSLCGDRHSDLIISWSLPWAEVASIRTVLFETRASVMRFWKNTANQTKRLWCAIFENRRRR